MSAGGERCGGKGCLWLGTAMGNDQEKLLYQMQGFCKSRPLEEEQTVTATLDLMQGIFHRSRGWGSGSSCSLEYI